MSQEKIKNIIEAMLMVSTEPLSVRRLLAIFAHDKTIRYERPDIYAAIDMLKQDYQERGLELVETASGFRFQVKQDYVKWVAYLLDEQPPRYSRALLETLAIIAYRQPITRAEIEAIRGVSLSGTIIKTLQERGWVKVVGRRDLPGRPELLATTKTFLDYFNLKKLSDLPNLEDIKDLDSVPPDLFSELGDNANSNAAANAATESTPDQDNTDDSPVETVAEIEEETITANV